MNRHCLLLFILSLLCTSVQAKTWFLGDDKCHRLPGNTLEEEFEGLKDRWGEDLRVLAPPHTDKGVRFFFAIGTDADGISHPFYVTESYASCMKGLKQLKANLSKPL